MSVRILTGDCRDVLKTLPDESVHCCITSPPYWGLRSYGIGTANGEIGLEPSVTEYVETMRAVFAEVRRVLRRDGTLFLNLGDSYAGNNNRSGEGESRNLSTEKFHGGKAHLEQRRTVGETPGLKPKDLCGIPWRVAFALQADGWYLRSDIIWSKPNPMPESVTDRPTKAHEYLFLLTKSERYFYDAEAIAEDLAESTVRIHSSPGVNIDRIGKHQHVGNGHSGLVNGDLRSGKRNRRSVWEIATAPYSEAHFATFPPALVEPCILAGCPHKACAKCGAPWVREVERSVPASQVDPSEIDRFGNGNAGVHRKIGGQYQKWLDENPKQTLGFSPSCSCNADTVPGTVLDPFGGSGTVGLVALNLNRSAILIELNADYVAMARNRVHTPLFAQAAMEEIA